MTALTPTQSQLPLELLEIEERAESYADKAYAQNTRRAYAADWTHFIAWCQRRGGLSPLPAYPRTIVLYITELAEQGRKTSTIGRRLVTIAQAHRAKGLETPTELHAVQVVWRGIRRALGIAPEPKAPILVDQLRQMVAALPDNTLGLRDKALLLVGFAGAFRRSELVGLDIEDIDRHPEGFLFALRRSKTDQEGVGRRVAVPFARIANECPLRTLEAWLAHASIESGPIFRPVTRHGHVKQQRLSSKAVGLVIKRAAQLADLDPTALSGHSLRAGLVTSAAIAGATERAIMKQTGHTSPRSLRRYIRDAELFRHNAAAAVL